MKVLFAPDYRRAVPYQQLLADALSARGVEVEFMAGYRRGLPMYRAVKASTADLLHLHWPEEYYLARHPAWGALRKMRYPFDLFLTTRRMPVVVTAHDLRPHNRDHEWRVAHCADLTLRRADAVFAHSTVAAGTLADQHSVTRERTVVIPHGDLSVATGPPHERSAARAELQLGTEPLCLICGTIEPYKGIEPVIEYWRRARPAATLAIVGKPASPAYRERITTLAGDTPGVRLVFGFQPEAQFRLWLSAVDCVIFNFAEVFTSGAAALARSWGIPILLPQRLASIDLAEPDPRVFRFEALEASFAGQLEAALRMGRDWDAAEAWRHATRWEEVARLTHETYRKVLA